MKSAHDRVLYGLLAYGVQRWHVEPVSRQQNVGEHSGRVALWITLLHTSPSANLLKAALWHDLEERVTGDLPHWTKAGNPRFHLAAAEVSRATREEYELGFEMNDEDTIWLESADLFDAWLFLWEETKVKNSKWMLGDYMRASASIKRKQEEGRFPLAIFEVFNELEQNRG